MIMAILSSSQIGVGFFLSFVSLAASAAQCPAVPVSVNDDGSLTFRPLSTRSGDTGSNYDPGAIGGWYSLPSGFIDAVRSGSLPYDLIKSELNSLNVQCSIPGLNNNCTSSQTSADSSFDVAQLIRSFVGWLAGLIVVTLIGGILAFSFLICCCCFWCCRCCGNCGGGKTQKVTKNRDCMTFSFTAILLLFTILLLVGVILAFFSNEQTYRSLDNLQESVNNVTGTGANFISNTLTEIEELLCQLAAPNNSILSIIFSEARGFGRRLDTELKTIENEVVKVLNTLQTLPEGLTLTIDALSNVTRSTQALITSFASLLTTLESISDNLDSLITNCLNVTNNQSMCNMLIPRPNTVRASADYNLLPNVTSELDAARRALEDLDISQAVAEGQSEFDSVRRSITTGTDDAIANVTNELQSAVDLAHDVVGSVITAFRAFLDDDVTQCKSLIDGSVFSNLETNIGNILANSTTGQVPSIGYIQECIINQGFETLQQYDVYRYAFGVIICSVSLITVVSVLFGILLGMFGFRKNVDPIERTRLSHCGGTILLIGVTITFVLGSLLMIIAALMFFFGASAQKLCNSLEHPNYPLFTELVDDQEFWGGSLGGQLLFKSVNPSITDAVLSVSVVLRNCERNEALFTAFNLTNLLSAGSVSAQIRTSINISQVDEVVDGLVNEAANNFNFTNTSFLPEQAQMSLNMFVGANVQDINITDFEEELNKEVLAFNLNDTIENLTEFQNNLQAAGGMMSLETEVEQLINQLLGLLTDQIPTIINQVDTLKADITQLGRAINTTVLTTARVTNNINDLVHNLTGPLLTRFLDNTVLVTIERTVDYIDQYINHLEYVVTRNVSRCQPLWRIYSSTYDSVCGVFLDGLNGFWWSLGFCCLFFVPVIIFSVVTSSCYMRKDIERTKDKPRSSRSVVPMEPITADQKFYDNNVPADDKHSLETHILS